MILTFQNGNKKRVKFPACCTGLRVTSMELEPIDIENMRLLALHKTDTLVRLLHQLEYRFEDLQAVRPTTPRRVKHLKFFGFDIRISWPT